MERYRALLQQARFMFAFPTLLITFYVISSNSHHARVVQRPIEIVQTSRVSVREVQDSPLRIIAVKDNPSASDTPQVDLVIMNVSRKPISAYAMRYDIVSGQSTSSGIELSIAALPRSILQPNQSAQTDVGGGEHHTDSIDRIIVSVDFVEFTDGSTWGPDTYNSIERIAGQRAGARAATQKLLKIFQSRGSIAVVDAVEAEALDIPLPPDHSPEWVNGFQSGLGYIKGRVIQAYKEGGVVNIESALRQPVDASDRRSLQ